MLTWTLTRCCSPSRGSGGSRERTDDEGVLHRHDGRELVPARPDRLGGRPQPLHPRHRRSVGPGARPGHGDRGRARPGDRAHVPGDRLLPAVAAPAHRPDHHRAATGPRRPSATTPIWENQDVPRSPTRVVCALRDTERRRTRPRCDRPRDHPQLLHHRAHRPRQVDAGRPDAAADRRGRRARRAGAVPRPDGHRARARHHDQEPGRPDAVDGAGGQRRRAPSPAPTCST